MAENFFTQFREWGRRRAGKGRGLGAGVAASGWERGREGGGCKCVWWALGGSHSQPGAPRPRTVPPPPPCGRNPSKPPGPERLPRAPLPLLPPTPGPRESLQLRRVLEGVSPYYFISLVWCGMCAVVLSCSPQGSEFPGSPTDGFWPRSPTPNGSRVESASRCPGRVGVGGGVGQGSLRPLCSEDVELDLDKIQPPLQFQPRSNAQVGALRPRGLHHRLGGAVARLSVLAPITA